MLVNSCKCTVQLTEHMGSELSSPWILYFRNIYLDVVFVTASISGENHIFYCEIAIIYI